MCKGGGCAMEKNVCNGSGKKAAALKTESIEARGDKKKSRRGEGRREREEEGRAIYLLRRNISKKEVCMITSLMRAQGDVCNRRLQ